MAAKAERKTSKRKGKMKRKKCIYDRCQNLKQAPELSGSGCKMSPVQLLIIRETSGFRDTEAHRSAEEAATAN